MLPHAGTGAPTRSGMNQFLPRSYRKGGGIAKSGVVISSFSASREVRSAALSPQRQRPPAFAPAIVTNERRPPGGGRLITRVVSGDPRPGRALRRGRERLATASA